MLCGNQKKDFTAWSLYTNLVIIHCWLIPHIPTVVAISDIVHCKIYLVHQSSLLSIIHYRVFPQTKQHIYPFALLLAPSPYNPYNPLLIIRHQISDKNRLLPNSCVNSNRRFPHFHVQEVVLNPTTHVTTTLHLSLPHTFL